MEKSQQQSTIKKLQEARLQSDYERIKGILDRIPQEIIRAYTQRGSKKQEVNHIADWDKDEWSGFADLPANLIGKYAVVLDIDNLPESPNCLGKETVEATNIPERPEDAIEKAKIE